MSHIGYCGCESCQTRHNADNDMPEGFDWSVEYVPDHDANWALISKKTDKAISKAIEKISPIRKLAHENRNQAG